MDNAGKGRREEQRTLVASKSTHGLAEATQGLLPLQGTLVVNQGI